LTKKRKFIGHAVRKHPYGDREDTHPVEVRKRRGLSQRAKELKKDEMGINQYLKTFSFQEICPKCKSSVCRCGRNG